MSLDAAAFLVNRGGTNYFCQGKDLADRMQVGDKVLVQRNGQRFYTWYGKSADTPYLTRRIEFNNQCYLGNDGNQNQHTDEPGEANLSYWYNCGGPSPIKEWRNIRNKNAGSFVDLDGEDFKLLDQSLISEGSICRITSDAGWKSWHEIEFKGGNDQIGFKPQYTNDDGRERTDLKVEGVANSYKPANGEILTLDFLDPEAVSAFSDIEDGDLLLAWDGSNNRRVTGLNFKTLFGPKPKPEIDGNFGITPDKAAYSFNGLIQATFTGMKPGYTREDYTQAYETVSRLSTAATPHVDLRLVQGSQNYTLAAHWKYELLPVTVQKDVELYLDFIDRETRVKTSYSMTVTLRPRSAEELEAEAEACHRECYKEYQNCKLLCETEYCRSICDAQFEECVKDCYESRGLAVPLLLIPPPRA